MKQLLNTIVDRFKMKNPLVFTILTAVLLLGAYGIETVTTQQICLTDATGVENCHLAVSDSAIEILGKIKWAFLSLAGLLGAHTKPAPSPTPPA